MYILPVPCTTTRLRGRPWITIGLSLTCNMSCELADPPALQPRRCGLFTE